jgi:hypothetical protein
MSTPEIVSSELANAFLKFTERPPHVDYYAAIIEGNLARLKNEAKLFKNNVSNHKTYGGLLFVRYSCLKFNDEIVFIITIINVFIDRHFSNAPRTQTCYCQRTIL